MGESFVGGLIGGAGGAALGTLYVELMADSAKLVKGMATAELSVKHGVGSILKEVGMLSAEVTGALALVGFVAVEEFAKFDKAMMRSLAVMKDVSPAIRKEMEETARSIAKNSITSAEELAASYGTLAQAGLTAEQSMLALGKVNELARTGTLSMKEATDLLVESQASLGMKVDETAENMTNMTRVSDVLVKASTLTSSSVKQLGEALIGKTGAALRSVNKDVEEGVAILATYARQGLKGAEAGASLTIVLRQLQKAAIENRETFEKYGIAVFDSTGKMRDMADIVADIETSFKGASTETVKAGLATLGFEQRSVLALQTLIGMSGRIREYEEALKSAGGTTQHVAEGQMEAFHSQLQISTNRIKDLLITIGEGLEPALKELNGMLQTLTNTNTAANESIKESAHVYGTALVYAVKGAIMVFEGWRDLLKMVAIGVLQLVEWVVQGCGKIAQGAAAVVNGVIQGVQFAINKIIVAINYWVDMLPDWVKEELGTSVIPEVKFKASVEFDKTQFDADIQMLEDAKASIWDSLVKTSVDAAKAIDPPMEHIEHAVEAAAHGVAEAAKEGAKGLGTMQEEAKRAKEELDKLLTVLDKIGSPQSPLRAMGITDQKDLDALMKLGVSKGTLDDLSKIRSPKGLDATGLADPFASQSMGLTKEMQDAQDHLKLWEEINGQELAAHKELQEAKAAAVEAYNQKLKQLQQAQALIITSAYQTAFDSIGNAVAGFAGKQSAAYKAMFAASKAFAIAEATIKIMQGIATAAGGPWPENIIAMASVAAATAGIVSNIQSVALAIDEKAEGGPVAAGKSFLVGERGPELFVPSASGVIVPNHQLSSTASSNMGAPMQAGGQPVRVVINNFTDAKPEVRERSDGQGKIIEVVLKRVKGEISSEVREGRGDVSKAMEASYGLRRGKA